MRVLLALDGSTSSDAARQLVGSIDWPDGSVIEIVAVLEPIVDLIGTTVMPMPTANPQLEYEATHDLEKALADSVATIEKPGRVVTRALLHGHPAAKIVEEASTFHADLVVVGSRGLGPVAAVLLGSVSESVVDHAPCPVLVVRRPTLSSILLAVDGSGPAQAAATFLRESPLLTGRHLEVLSVAGHSLPATPMRVIEQHTPDVDPDAPRVDEHREWAESIATDAAQATGATGASVRWSISQGDAAHEIIEAVESFDCDLVVMGSRGMTGIGRLLVGSVARRVLLHTTASVLIVHEPKRRRAEDRTADPAVVA